MKRASILQPRRKNDDRAAFKRIAVPLAACACAAAVAFAGYFGLAAPTTAVLAGGLPSAVQVEGAQDGSAASGGQASASAPADPDGDGPDSAVGGSGEVPSAAPVPEGEGARETYAPGQVIVRPAEACTAAQLNAYLASLDFLETRSVSVEDVSSGAVKLSLKEGVTVESAVAALRQSQLLKGAQPNYRYYVQEGLAEAGDAASGSLAANAAAGPSALAAAALSAATGDASAGSAGEAARLVPNDPYATSAATPSQLATLDAMHLFEAWGLVTSDGAVGIAVIDEGFRATHEDLKNVVVDRYNAVTGAPRVYEVEGEQNHGTHVAGILGAQANNGKGIAGVSYNAKLALVQVADGEGAIYTDSILVAYDHILSIADRYRIRVINMSLGAGTTEPISDAALYDKMDEAYDAGIVTVCAACNVNTSNDSDADDAPPFYVYPGDHANAVTVINAMRFGNSYTVQGDSNYNVPGHMGKDISAPGTNIYSTYGTGASLYSSKTGTSMATPQVSGVLALIFAANPDLTPDQAESVLYSTATDLNARENVNAAASFDYRTGYGLVNAYDAVKLVQSGRCISGPVSLFLGGRASYSVPGASAGDFRWSVSDPSVATVDSSGTVCALRCGSVVLSAVSDDVRLVQTLQVEAPTPVYKRGASKMPVKSTSAWSLTNCSLRVVSGQKVVSVRGSEVTALAKGTAQIAVMDLAGSTVDVFEVKVYALSGSWRLRSAAKSSLYLQVRGDSLANRANVRLSPKRYSGTVFKLKGLKGGSVGLASRRSGKYVRVSGKKKNKANVYQYKKTSAKAMRWTMKVDDANRVSFVNVKTGKALTAASSKPRTGTNVYQYTDKGKLSQKWRIVSAG